ncbi:AAA family ATPase [Pseudoalteromonas sp. MMG010]|uniref:AAA family ATPase n=1 Tax=Pseudoalteromonas sp. MMG010 TaxID=2822685 RepID=UPI001B3A1516|nr:AAA family ATPase [Pseudoalteromonas sp. MMG010]MBQ4832282.1 AAA family ATPase [Pseudoalteromonas sp. MMG010]
MSLKQFIFQFFHQKEIIYKNDPLPFSSLSDEDCLTPVLMALIDWTLKDTPLENKLISFKLYKTANSLLGVSAQDIQFIDEDTLLHLLANVSLYLPIVSPLDENTLSMDHFFDSKNFNASDVKEGEPISVMQLLNNFFPQLKPLSLAKPLLDDLIHSNKKHNESARQDFFNELSNNLLNNKPQKSVILPFDIKKQYSQLDPIAKELIDEIALVSTAQYLSENASKSISANDFSNLKLAQVNYDVIFAAILNMPEMLSSLAHAFDCHEYQIQFAPSVYALRTNISEHVDIRTFDSDKGNTTNWYAQAKRTVFNLDFSMPISQSLSHALAHNTLDSDLLISLLLKINDEYISDLISTNKVINRSVKSIKLSQSLQHDLGESVKGQKLALEGVARGYLSSCLHVSYGPRTIYTFAGPSGVGKTYTANLFAEQLNKLEQTGYSFSTFNMEHFTHKDDAKKLMGSGNQYTDAALGLLTNMVRAQPRHIILFDEIEKAHPNVIQSLLSILDSGVTIDSTSSERVDFRQTIIIFTTNLGQDLFTEHQNTHQVDVFDVLRTSKNGQTGQGLSPEFVSRLSKGYPALFANLKINHFIKTVEETLKSENTHISGITFNWPEHFASFLLKTLSPEINMRLIQGALSELQASILHKAIVLLDEQQTNTVLNVTVDSINSNADKSKVLVLDDDPRVFDVLTGSLVNEEIVLCSHPSLLCDALKVNRPSTLLIDVDTLDHNSFAQLVDELVLQNPALIIFTYQLERDEPHAFYNYQHEEIREHFYLNSLLLNKELTAMFTRVNYYIETETNLDKMRKKNQMLNYQISVDTADTTINVTLHEQSTKQLVHSDDLRNGDLFKHSIPDTKLDDVIGLDRAKKRLKDVIGWLKHPSQLNHFGISVPSGYLFAGPSGTGKTLLARAVAGECELPFFAISAADLSAAHHGGTTHNIKKLFATARKYAPAIIFIDEIDAIASARTSNSSGAALDANLTVNTLLTEMDGFDDTSQLFVLAATNHPEKLDSAITRPGRFDETIYCDLPNTDARTLFFTRYAALHNLHWSEQQLLNLVALAQGMSPAQIQQVLKEAIQFAVSNNQQLSETLVEQAMVRVRYGSPSEHLFLSGDEKRRTAYHEAGHLIAYHLLFPNKHIDFITIEPRNQALGFVATRASTHYDSASKVTIMRKLQVLLAGRVAEKLYAGSADEISTGATSDIDKATKLAMHGVYYAGIEPAIGAVNIAILTKFEESDLLATAQQAVKRWIDTAEQECEKLLTEQFDLLKSVAQALIEKESLMGHEIDQLLNK